METVSKINSEISNYQLVNQVRYIEQSQAITKTDRIELSVKSKEEMIKARIQSKYYNNPEIIDKISEIVSILL